MWLSRDYSRRLQKIGTVCHQIHLGKPEWYKIMKFPGHLGRKSDATATQPCLSYETQLGPAKNTTTDEVNTSTGREHCEKVS